LLDGPESDLTMSPASNENFTENLAKSLGERARVLFASSAEDGTAGEPDAGEPYLVLHGQTEPRWIIPEASSLGLPVISRWRPYSVASRLKWQTLLSLYRLGLLARAPGVERCRIKFAANAWEEALGLPSSSLRPVVYVGVPGDTRKLVISLISAKTHAVVGILKFALGKQADENIANEAELLLGLERAGIRSCPRALVWEPASGLFIQSAVIGGLSGRAFTSKHRELLLSYRRSESMEMSACAEALERSIDQSALSPAQQALVGTALSELRSAGRYPAFWIHGDFLPWNLKRCGAEIYAIDWEEGETRGLPGQDIFHYHYMPANLFDESLDSTMRKCREAFAPYAQALGLAVQDFKPLLLAYLLKQVAVRAKRRESAHLGFLERAIAHTQSFA
jgi:hypothetical protein